MGFRAPTGVFLCIISTPHSLHTQREYSVHQLISQTPPAGTFDCPDRITREVIHPTAKTFSNLLPSYVSYFAARLQSAPAYLSCSQTMALLKIIVLKTISTKMNNFYRL